jgi:hypothetical protein
VRIDAVSDKPKTIDASPTKQFFIHMLTRDIELSRAIIDLIDNSVDGALRLRGDPRAARPYDGLSVRLEISPEGFRIADNCGGIDVETAMKYAFRFGRPPGFEEIPHSIGQFGVGMKRALFKLGTHFRVVSDTESSHFAIDVDVEKWKQEIAWTFPFADLDERSRRPEEETGTTIDVAALHESVKERFGLENYVARLREEISGAHQLNLQKGLTITVNQIPLGSRTFELLQSDRLEPGHKKSVYRRGGKPVTVRLYAGVGESDPDEAGWYVFCNGRLILGAEKTATTGWGADRERTIPRYHNQFARFRGLAFFDCDDASRLPWNTTKTGIDADSSIYTTALTDMIQLARPVIDFLNKLKEEREDEGEEGPLSKELDRATGEDFDEVRDQGPFVYPKTPPRPPAPPVSRITYYRPSERVERAKEIVGASTNRELGERTFDYFYEREVED